MTPGDPGTCSGCGAPAVLEPHGVWWHADNHPCPPRVEWLSRKTNTGPEFVPDKEGRRT